MRSLGVSLMAYRKGQKKKCLCFQTYTGMEWKTQIVYMLKLCKMKTNKQLIEKTHVKIKEYLS